MQEELRRSNSIGNAEGVNALLSCIFEQKIMGVDALNHACRFLLFYQLNCRLGLLLLEDLGIIRVKKDCISLSSENENLLHLPMDECKERLAQITINKMLEDKLLDFQKLNVDSITGTLRIPINAITFDATIYATFLQALGCFRKVQNVFIFDNEVLREDFEKKVVQKRTKITQEELLLKLQQQQKDGETGERFVIEYERKRNSNLLHPPKWIAPIDAGAGYDILSCNSSDSNCYDRYIEVKSFRGKPHFYWSANEKRVAELIGENYYLYLVDLSTLEKEEESYTPQIIPNPVANLNSDNWLIEPNSYLIQAL